MPLVYIKNVCIWKRHIMNEVYSTLNINTYAHVEGRTKPISRLFVSNKCDTDCLVGLK